VLGQNSLNQSFVTGFGANPVQHPYHWIYAALRIAMPGWASGGPNQYPNGADTLLIAAQQRGLPPAKCWVDSGNGGGSWASNEGETSENAALLFAAGYLSAEGIGNAGADAGTDASSDAGPEAATVLTPAGGCGCAVGGSTADGKSHWIAVLAALAAVSRMRRCRSRRQS
jgi:MYXO-CTERM domain-containing protein